MLKKRIQKLAVGMEKINKKKKTDETEKGAKFPTSLKPFSSPNRHFIGERQIGDICAP